MKWIVGSGNHGCWLGTYELTKQHALERCVRPGMTIYDIGAQAGFYSLFFSSIVGDEGMVFAFEPCPYEARYLIDHIRLNQARNIRVIQAAVSDSVGLGALTVDRGQTQNTLTDRSDAVLRVPTIRLDEMELLPPQLIKIDVEGAESAVLRGAKRTIERYHPTIFVALHGPQQRHFCAVLLREAGYILHDLAGGAIGGAVETDEIFALPPV